MTAPEFTDADLMEECAHMALHWRQCAEESPHEIPRLVNARRARLFRAIAARIEATSTDWQPPPDRDLPDGFRCQGWCGGEWRIVVWASEWLTWRDACGFLIDRPTHFAPLPKVPT